MHQTQSDLKIMKQTIALFPGQGSQFVGMGKDLFTNFKAAAETFEEASDAIRVDLKKLCFEGPDAELTLTENTQPCLLVSSVAAFRVASAELGFRPSAVAGHSLGEYSALVAAGALPLATATQWVRERGKAMQSAVPAGQGSMAALLQSWGAEEDAKVRELCKRATASAIEKRAKGETADIVVEAIVEPANFNAPGQIVMAGSKDAIDEAIALAKAGGDFAGAKALPLQVSAPFHCRLMKPARDRMAELFSKAKTPNALTAPYIPNRTARLTSETGTIFELLVEQVDHPVLWKQSMTTLLTDGLQNAVEFGPGKVLTGLMKRIGQPLGKTCASFQMSESAHLKPIEDLMKGPSA
jgi:[acyl-carrier-protein] S-malonyltransferase